MKALQRLSATSAGAAFLLIFTGGLVRVSGAGLGCPDWPRCFGRWLPPTSIDQLPASVDPSLFNFTLAWIEYGNRMLGMILGLLILATAIVAIVQARNVRKVWIAAWINALLVAYIGWQGGQVVAAALEPLLVSVHMIGALLVASIALWIALQVHSLTNPSMESGSKYPKKILAWIGITWGAALLQTALGTQVRAAVKVLVEEKPLAGENVWLAAVGPIRHIHELLGIIVAGLAVHVAVKLLKRSENPSGLVVQSSWVLAGLGVFQVILGVAMIAVTFASILKLFHLWVASLMLGLLLLLYVIVKQSEKGEA